MKLYRELHDPRGMALTLYRLGWIASSRGDDHGATSLFEESLAHAREAGDKHRFALSLAGLALAAFQLADQCLYPRVRSLLEESLALFREECYQSGIAWSLYGLGLLYFQQGDAAAARPLFEESLALFTALGQRLYIAHLRCYLGKAMAELWDLPAAHACYQESLALFVQLDDQGSVAVCLEGWARVVAQRGDAAWAAQVWGTVQKLREAGASSDLSSLVTFPGEDADDEQSRSRVRDQLGEQGFAQALAAGRAMTPEQALSARGHTLPSGHPPEKSAMGATVDRSQVLPPTAPDDLTRREVEVLRLVAQGLTDAQIAEALVISPRTVNAHLRSIYTKLDITSRNAATYFALEHGLI